MRVTFDSNKTDSPNGPKKTNKSKTKQTNGNSYNNINCNKNSI